jgi:hypothetical protein
MTENLPTYWCVELELRLIARIPAGFRFGGRGGFGLLLLRLARLRQRRAREKERETEN